LLNNYFWSAVRQWGQRLGSALTFVMLARILPANEIGLFSAALAIMALAEIFNENGVGEAVVRAPYYTNESLMALNIVNIGMAVMLGIGILLSRGAIEAFFHTPGLGEIVSVLTAVLLLNAFVYIPMALLRRDMAFRALAKIGLVATLLGSVVGIGGALLGAGIWALTGQALTFAIVNALLLNRHDTLRLATRPDFAGARPMFAFGGFVLLGNVMNYASTRAVELALPYHYGAAALATYVIGSRFFFVASQMVTAVALDVGLSNLARHQQDDAAFDRALSSTLRMGALVAAFIFTGLAAVAQPFCIMLFGDIGRDAWPYLLVTAMGGNLYLLSGNIAIGLKARGHIASVTATAALQSIAVLGLLVPRWDIQPIMLVAAVSLMPALVIPIRAICLQRSSAMTLWRLVATFADIWCCAAFAFLAAYAVQRHVQITTMGGAAMMTLVQGSLFVALFAIAHIQTERLLFLRDPLIAARPILKKFSF